ncbi:MAG: hypothetical protein WC748_10810 [Legionellales bacterium]|jgi:hypothetical protein
MQNDIIVLAGDSIDKMDDHHKNEYPSYDLIHRIITINAQHKKGEKVPKIYSVLGNHEAMFLCWAAKRYFPEEIPALKERFGSAVFESLADCYLLDGNGGGWALYGNLSQKKLRELFNYFKTLPLVLSGDNFIVVHSLLPMDVPDNFFTSNSYYNSFGEYKKIYATLWWRGNVNKIIGYYKNIREKYNYIIYNGHTFFGGIYFINKHLYFTLDIKSYSTNMIAFVDHTNKIPYLCDRDGIVAVPDRVSLEVAVLSRVLQRFDASHGSTQIADAEIDTDLLCSVIAEEIRNKNSSIIVGKSVDCSVSSSSSSSSSCSSSTSSISKALSANINSHGDGKNKKECFKQKRLSAILNNLFNEKRYLAVQKLMMELLEINMSDELDKGYKKFAKKKLCFLLKELNQKQKLDVIAKTLSQIATNANKPYENENLLEKFIAVIESCLGKAVCDEIKKIKSEGDGITDYDSDEADSADDLKSLIGHLPTIALNLKNFQ